MIADIRIAFVDPRWRRALPQAETLVRRAAAAALECAGTGPLDVALADDSFLQALNRDFRGKDKPTNVLSFPSARGAGDMALALETCRREAQLQGKSLAHHVRHLVVHGTLHLRGYDHEAPDEAAAMEAHERRVLRRLGVADPYRAVRARRAA
jgi:probable rRNA maturation factor